MPGRGLVASKLGWCGCGDNEVVDRAMLAYLSSGADGMVLAHPATLADELIAYMADALEWTEHGTTIHGAWLTLRGKWALRGLRRLYRDAAA